MNTYNHKIKATAVIMLLMALVSLLSGCLYTKDAAIRKFCSQKNASAHYVDTLRGYVISQADTGNVIGFDCEKFKAMYDSLLAVKIINRPDQLYNDGYYVPIHEDSSIIVEARPNKSKGTDLRFIAKPKQIPYAHAVDTVIAIPCDCPELCPQNEWQKAVAAKWWIILALAIGICLGLYITVKLKGKG